MILYKRTWKICTRNFCSESWFPCMLGHASGPEFLSPYPPMVGCLVQGKAAMVFLSAVVYHFFWVCLSTECPGGTPFTPPLVVDSWYIYLQTIFAFICFIYILFLSYHWGIFCSQQLNLQNMGSLFTQWLHISGIKGAPASRILQINMALICCWTDRHPGLVISWKYHS